jgi:CRISPR-associated protein Csc1
MYITTCQLTLHDNLFYASREMGRLYETERYLHNYGLTYALGAVLNLRRPYFNADQVPTYQADLTYLAREREIYITPAYPLEYSFVFNTFKLGDPAFYSFTPQVINNRVVYGRAKELAPDSRFEFFIFSPKPLELPRWLRLGKWMSKAELVVTRAGEYKAVQPPDPVQIACPLNPLDLPIAGLVNFDLVNMPPVSLLINAVTKGPCYEVSGKKTGGDVFLPANLAYFGGESSK